MMFRHRSRNRPGSGLLLTTALAGGLILPMAAVAQTANGTLPNASDATVLIGSATITGGGPTAGSTLNVALNTGTTVIDWYHFDVPATDTARFTNASSVPLAAVLNRVRVGGPVAITGPSTLAGTITAPGVELWIQNAEGFLFGNGLAINSGGFIASVPDIGLGEFLTGGTIIRATAPTGSTRAIQGGGTAARILTGGGRLVLIAPAINISGTFDAGSGAAAFVTATDVTIDMTPGSPLSLTVNRGTSLGGASQVVAGSVTGGEAYFVLASAASVVDAILDVGASVKATSAVATGRGVVLSAGKTPSAAPGVTLTGGIATDGSGAIRTSGTIDATGTGQEIALRATGAVTATRKLTAAGRITTDSATVAFADAAAGTGITLKATGTAAATGKLETAVGAIDVAGTALTLDDLTARTGLVKLVGTAIVADDIVAGTTVQATATTGATTIGSIAAAGNVVLTGAPGAAVQVTRALASTGGGVAIDGSGAVRLGSVDVFDTAIIGATTIPASITATGTTRAASLNYRATGDIALGDTVTTTGAIALTAGGLLKTAALVSGGGGIVGKAATIDIAGATATGAALALTATGATLKLGVATAGTGATISATAGDAAIGSLTSTLGTTDVNAATLSGSTATTGATLNATAGAVKVVTTAAAALNAVTAGTTFDVTSGATLRIDGAATAAGAVTLTAPGATSLGSVTSTGGAVTVMSGGTLTGVGVAAGDLAASGVLAVTAAGATVLDALSGATVTVTAPSLTIGSATARTGDVTLTATAGNATLGDGTASNDVLVTATGTASVAGAVSAGRDYIVSGAAARLGDDADSEVQRAARVASITATTGSITGGAGLTLIGDGAGVGIGNAVRLLATNGAITLPGSAIQGGPLRTSDIALRFAAGTPLVLGDVAARAIGRSDAANAPVIPLVHDAGITFGNVSVNTPFTVTTTAGSITIRDISAGPVTLTAGGAGNVTTAAITSTGAVRLSATDVTTGDVTAAAALDVTATGAITGGSLRGTTVTLLGGRIQATDIVATTGAVDARTTAGRLGVSGSVTAAASATLRAVGDIQVGQANSVGTLSLTATGAITTGNLTSSAGDVAVAAGGAATLGVVSGNSASVTAGSIAATSVTARTGALTLAVTAGDLSVGRAEAPGNVTLSATGNLSAQTVISSAGNATLTAGGAASLGSVAANTVTVTAGTITAATDVTARAGTATLTSTTGSLSAGAVRATGTITLKSAAALTTQTADSSAGDIAATANGAATLGTAAGNVVGVKAAAIDVTTTTARVGIIGLTATAGAVKSGTATAVGTVAVAASAGVTATSTTSSAGDVGITAGGAATLGTVAGSVIDIKAASIDATTLAARDALALNATATSLKLATGTATNGVTITSNDTVDADTVTVGGTVTITAGGAATLGTITGSAVTTTARSIAATRVVARTGAVALTATGGTLALGSLRADGGSATLISNTGLVSLKDSSTIAGDLTITGDTVTLGDDSDVEREVIAARDTVRVTARTGDITGLAGLTLQSDSGGAGARNLYLDATAGNIAFASDTRLQAGLDFQPGSDRLSTIGLRAGGGAITLGSASGIRIGGIEGALTIAGISARTFVAAGPLQSRQGFAMTGTGTGAITVGAVTVTDAGAAITLAGAANPITANGALVAPGTITIDTGGAVKIGSATSTAAGITVRGATIDATSTAANNGPLALTTTGALTLGTGTALTTATVSAAGAATIGKISATNGAVTVDAASAAITTADAGTSLAVNARGGAITLGTGTAKTTARLISKNDSVSPTVFGNITVSTGLTSGGTAAPDGTILVDGTATIDGNNLQLANVTAAAGSVMLTAKGAVTGLDTGNANLSAGGKGSDVTVSAVGLARLGTVIAPDAVTVSGTTITATTTTATGGLLDLNATAGALTLGTGTAGAAATLRSTAAMSVGTLTARGATLQSGGTLSAATVSSGGDIAATATGAATLGTLTAIGAITASGNGLTATRFDAGTTLGVTSGAALSIGSARATGAATINAAGLATLGTIAAGPSLLITATDAEITGTQSATSITVTNRTPAATALRLGDGTASGGFTLSNAEMARFDTATLTLDGGTGAIEVGKLDFAAGAGRSAVNVLTTGRIDVRGVVTGSGAGRAFRFGGTANLTDRASAIIVTTTPTAGGRLLFSTADLDLRGTRVAQGQAAGFLDAIAPLSPADVANRFVGNAGSSLYSANQGGTAYDAAATTILSANRLTVRFGDYAVFQNTGQLGENSGAVIAAAAGPALNFIAAGATNGTGSLAIFGSVNGVTNIATALLGPSVIGAIAVDLRSARVNGCLLGSGAGCLSNVVSQPILSIFDPSRTQILRAADNLAVPFDPVVGTNNEALFSGVSSIDAPPEDVTPPPPCPPGSAEPCPPKETVQ